MRKELESRSEEGDALEWQLNRTPEDPPASPGVATGSDVYSRSADERFFEIHIKQLLVVYNAQQDCADLSNKQRERSIVMGA
ncbi:hypothetical protein RRG08_011855 [Elysia crispata]|uniref:Uncharacterized protein n=1 Tax=Elysia crispata TaxID=231223 RepID=A0AAE0ZNX8_9GAST|nr:hypothetical protein RRG08_011855 [Elysia crispata]